MDADPHSGEIITSAIALAAAIAGRSPAARHPFHVVIGVQLLQIALFETLGATEAWANVFTAFSLQPVWPYAGVALFATAISLLWAWRRKPTSGTFSPRAVKVH